MTAATIITLPSRTRPTTRGSLSWRENAPRIHTLAHPSGPVLPHSDRDRYLDHVEKHLAKQEALHALSFALPQVADLAEFSSDRTLIRALRCDVHDPRADRVLAGYLHCAQATLDEAFAHGWVISPRSGTTIAFASSGLLAVIEGGVLKTLFFPGIESTESRSDRLGHSALDSAAERRLNAGWSAEERHYYRVFRPALQLIRSMPDDRAVGAHSQYGALKRVLPQRVRALSFEAWMSYRARSVSAQVHGFVRLP